MRQPYRRRGGKGRVVLWGSLLTLVLGLMSVLAYAALAKSTDGMAPQEWADVWDILAVASMMVLGVACFLWQLRGPTEESSLPLVGRTFLRTKGRGWERFSQARSPHIAGAVSCFGMALGLALVPALSPSARESRPTWFIPLIPGVVAASLGWSVRRPASLLIDREGITLPTTSRLRWNEINEIRTSPSHNMRGDPLNDEIEIHLRDGPARLKAAIYRLQTWNRLGADPTDVLDAMDRFRPQTVPIHDPRRIAEEGQP